MTQSTEGQPSGNQPTGQPTQPTVPLQQQPYPGAQQPDTQYTQQGTYPGAQQPGQPVIPQVVVQMPPKKRSIAATIIAIVVAIVLVACCSCSAISLAGVAGSIGSLSSLGSAGTITMGDSIAVIHIEGSIAGSGSGYITPEAMYSVIQKAEDDPNVKAIVLRIDSGGGTSAGGQEIATYIADCSKPVVVSCSDVCASAAYEIASQADYVIALPASSVGAIGTLMTTLDISTLLEELGIEMDSITSTDSKDAGAIYRALTDEERAYLQAQVDVINAQFIQMVADGRGMTVAEVEALATGQTFTGIEAVENGLVDATGTYEDALEYAAQSAGLSDYDVVTFDPYTSIDLSSLLQ